MQYYETLGAVSSKTRIKMTYFSTSNTYILLTPLNVEKETEIKVGLQDFKLLSKC